MKPNDDLYQVKFTDPAGVTHYGIAESYGEDAERARESGNVLVGDAILPAQYEVPVGSVTPLDIDDGEFDQYIEAEFKKAREASAEAGPGVVVGKLFRIGVGDGYAWYVVTKVRRSSCDVAWRGFSGDRWADHHYGYGRKASVKDVGRYISWDKWADKTFGRKTG